MDALTPKEQIILLETCAAVFFNAGDKLDAGTTSWVVLYTYGLNACRASSHLIFPNQPDSGHTTPILSFPILPALDENG